MSACLLVLLSASLYALAFPPWNVTVAAWIALVPFFSVTLARRPRHSLLAGLLWGTATIWAVAFWVPTALTFYYQQPWWFGLLFCACSSVIFWGAFYATFAGCAGWAAARTPPVLRPLLIAILWVSCEFARARLLTGEPWLLLGYALVPDVTLIQVADLGGVYLLSFVLAFVNASVAEAMRCARREPRRLPGTLAPAGVLLVLVYAYGMSRIAAPLPQTPAVRIAVVQGNNDLGMQWRPEFYGRGLEQYLRLSMQAAQRTHPRLIVWPESAVTFFLAHEPHYQALIARTLTAIGADLIVGAPHYEDADPARPAFFNSVFYMTADGQLRGRYDKARLLPFAEYFPLRTIEFLRRDFERVRYFTAGDGTTLLHTRIGTAAVVVCFEAIFPELVRRQMARGADVLLNVSNDVWLGRNAGPAQHLTMASLRAVENRTWLIRATTTGVSAIIDPLGRVRERSSTFAAAVLDGYIVPMQVDTVYKRYGDVFAYACVAAAIVALLWVAWCGNREADRVAAKGERSKQER